MIGGVLDCEAMEALTAVQWQKPKRYHVESVCGRYTIAKTYTGERAHYTLWRRLDGKWAFESMHDSFDEAKEAAR